MSLVRDSIAGRLAAARNARAKTLVGVAGTGVVSWNCSAVCHCARNFEVGEINWPDN